MFEKRVNNNDIQIPYCRLNIYKNSFFPSTISRWNKLPLATRNSISVNQFKSRLNASYQNSNRSKFFLCGCRKLNVLHTKIRHGCSQLNSDLARINLKPNSSCICGHPREDASHYLIFCPIYDDIRESMRAAVIRTGASFDIGTLLYGNRDLSYDNNKTIFLSVHKYIKNSGRFA